MRAKILLAENTAGILIEAMDSMNLSLLGSSMTVAELLDVVKTAKVSISSFTKTHAKKREFVE